MGRRAWARLFVRRKPRVRIEAQMHGGGHERGMRSGTLADAPDRRHGRGVPHRASSKWRPRTSASGCCATASRRASQDIEEIYINGDLERRVPHNLNVSFNYVEGESLIMAIKDIAVSSGSACTSASLEPSYVLRALGTKRRARAQLDPVHDRPLHDRGRDRLHDRPPAPQGGEAPRAVAVVGNVQGRRRPRHRPMGGTLMAP